MSVAAALGWGLGCIAWGAQELATDGGRAAESGAPERVVARHPHA